MNIENTEISGTKTWIETVPGTHNNKEEITLTLYKATEGQEPVQVEGAVPVWNGNTYTFTDLPKYDVEGNLCIYSVQETCDGYTSVVSENGLDVTNIEQV